MTAFDSDVLSDLFLRQPRVVAQLTTVAALDQYVPIVVAEEILRGRLHAIRKAQSNPRFSTLELAYREFDKSLTDLKRFQILAYTTIAHSIFTAWRAAKLRVGTQDLRIAAIAVAHDATLVTRNRRDYEQIPGLKLDVWA
ncbi:MAG: type II toxin-antitoxin system VapC family toxin [Bacteroidales bacterium]|nr:type II toxin-antitoxin system VapC family toxin [Bacteroidales bacterium]